VDGARTDPTALSARLSPMPLSVSADVDILGDDSYHAVLTTSAPTDLAIDYVDALGGASTTVTAAVNTFPGRLEVNFDPNLFEYTASGGTDQGGNDVPLRAPIDEVDFSVLTVAPGERTTQLDAELRRVPAKGSLTRSSDTRVAFSAPQGIGSATVDFASFEPATSPPALMPAGDQYLVADVGINHAAAKVRVLGLTHVDVDAGDPIIIDLHHTAGPFILSADVTTARTAEPGDPPPVPATETRNVDGHVLDLPAEGYVEFSPSTQAFEYTGSAEVGELSVDVISSVPFVDDARHASLLAQGVPTGLHGQLNAAAKTFDATLVNGAVSLIEVQVTSGAEERLPDGVDGVLVKDHVGTYDAFARITGLRRVAVGWSEKHQFAEVDHTAGPFHLLVDTDDTDTKDIQVDGRLLDLPAQARFDHIPTKPITCPKQPCGETPLLITFATDDPTAAIAQLTFDVVSAEPLVGNATIAHLVASQLPPLSITVDATGKRFLAKTTRGTLGSIAAELCSATGCGLLGTSGADGAFLVDLESGVYDAVVRLNGLRRAEVAWGTPMLVDVDHDAGPFDVFVEQDYQVAVPDDPTPQPPPPCDLPKPRDCEIVDDDEPLPPGTHPVTYRRSLHVEVRDLPATVHLTYDAETQHVTYVGVGDWFAGGPLHRRSSAGRPGPVRPPRRRRHPQRPRPRLSPSVTPARSLPPIPAKAPSDASNCSCSAPTSCWRR
jgi:hypothetical protein